MISSATLLLALLLGQTGPIVNGTPPANDVRVVAGAPGDYRIISSDGQLVMASYKITSLPSALRTNVRRTFIRLLEGDPGARVEVTEQWEGGRKIVLLLVVATEQMQQTIAAAVVSINAGQMVDFIGTVPANVVYVPKYRSAEAIAAAVRPELTSSGTIHVDKILNALTIEDDPAIINFLVENIAKTYDQPTPRIVARVHVVEFIDGRDRGVGVNWQALLDALPANMSVGIGGDRALLDRSVSITRPDTATAVAGTRQGSLKVSNFSAAVDQINPQVLAGFLNYLETKGLCKVVNDSNLNVVNGAPSFVRSAVEAQVQATVAIPNGGKERADLTTIEGVELRIEGDLAQEGQRLHVVGKSTSVVSYTLAGLPMILTTDFDTTVGVPTGNKTILLSGLSRQKDMEVEHKGPLDPLGWFSKKITERREWKIYICITTCLSDVVETPSPATYKK